MARKADVAESTVSFVLNGYRNVSPELRSRVMAAIEELGYRPHFAAGCLAGRRTGIISLLIKHLMLVEVHSEWVHHLQQACKARGLKLRIDSVEEFRHMASGGSADAFISLGRPLELLKDNGDINAPIFYSDIESHPVTENTVAIDNRLGGILAAHCLADLGHTRLGFVGYIPDNCISRERYQGFLEGLASKGIAGPSMVIGMGDWPLEADDMAPYSEALVEGVGKGTSALVVSSDIGALGVMRILRRAGIPVPERVSVICFDDTRLTRSYEPPITAIRQNVDTVSRELIRMVVESLETGSALPGKVMEPTLVMRATCGPLA